MISFSVDVIVPIADYKAALDHSVAVAVGNAMSEYIEAATETIPVWTGYTRAIWKGVAARVAEALPVTVPPRIDISGARDWYNPNRKAANPSTTVIDTPSEQQAKGFEDGYNAVIISKGFDGIFVRIDIPQYAGEQNYAIRESAWRSLATGELAYDEAFARLTGNIVDPLLNERRITVNG